jgi:hypothetical protein
MDGWERAFLFGKEDRLWCAGWNWVEEKYVREGGEVLERIALRMFDLVWKTVSRIQYAVPNMYTERERVSCRWQPSSRNVSSSRSDIFLHSALSKKASPFLDFTARPSLPVRPAALSALARQLRQLVASVEFIMR